MKKGLFILLIFCFSLTVISCSDEKEESTTDTTAPTLAEVTAVTTPTNDTTPDYTFSSDEAGTITYGGSCSSSTTSATAGTITVTLYSLSDGTYSNCAITVYDSEDYNVSVTLAIPTFTVDTTGPTLGNVTIASNNSVSTLAKTGDIITLSITSAEAIQTPSVSIAGQTAQVTSSDGITWAATYTMADSDSQGPVSLNIGFMDFAGNAGIAATSTSNGSAVRFDKTAPTLLDNLTIASNNTLYTTMAKTGDNITLSITSSEAIQTPSVRIAGQAATETGDNMTWSAAYTMTNSNTQGPVSLNIGFDGHRRQ